MAYRAIHVSPALARTVGVLGDFDAGATASEAAKTEVKAQLKSGDLDAAGAADTTAQAVAQAAGAAAGAAACAATGAGAAVAPLCGSAGAWIAGEVYGPVKKFFSGLFGGESAAAKFRRKLTAAQQRSMEAWGDATQMLFEARDVRESIVRALYEERKELGLPPYDGWNGVMRALRDEGLPVEVGKSWVDLSPTTGEWRKTQSTDPLTGSPMSETLSWSLPNGSSTAHKAFMARLLGNVSRLAEHKFLVGQYDRMATEFADWITKAREVAAIVAAKNAGEASARRVPAAMTRRPPALKPVAPSSPRPSVAAAAAAAASASSAASRYQAAQASAASQRTVLTVAGVAVGAFLIWKVAQKRSGR